MINLPLVNFGPLSSTGQIALGTVSMAEQDWRLEHLKTQPYLRGVSWARKTYRMPSPTWDHDHCVACWAKFAEEHIVPDSLREGYATTEDYPRGAEYEWVCIPC